MNIRLFRDCLALPFCAAFALHAAEPTENSAKQIKVEVRLLEMSPRQADLVEQTLLRWSVRPADQGAQLDQLLWGNGAKKITELIGVGDSGKRTSANNGITQVSMRAREEAVGADSAKYNVGDALEFQGALGPGDGECDVTLSFNRRIQLDDFRLESCKYTGTVRFFHGLPVMLGRRDFGATATVLVARVSWPAPIRRPASLNAPSPINVHAIAYKLPPSLLDEATKRQAAPRAFAEWLKKRGNPLAVVAVATRSGQRTSFDYVVQDRFLTPQKTREARNTTGAEIDVEFSLAEAGDSLKGTMGGRFSQPATDGGPAWTAIAGRYLQFQEPTPISLKAGAATAVSAVGELPGWAIGTFDVKIVVPADVFVVLQPIWIPAPTAAANAPGSPRQPSAPATPAAK